MRKPRGSGKACPGRAQNLQDKRRSRTHSFLHLLGKQASALVPKPTAEAPQGLHGQLSRKGSSVKDNYSSHICSMASWQPAFLEPVGGWGWDGGGGVSRRGGGVPGQAIGLA